MAEIVQKLGIDCADALQKLQQLDRGFASWEQRLRSTADALQRLNGPSKQVDKLGAAFKSNVPEAVKQTERLTTSLGLLSRIAFTQVVVSGLGKIKRSLQDTAKDAVDFQKAIARTVTIADGAQFGQIADGVRKISDEFNIPLLEVAEGVYQALGNQVGDFGESVKFSEEAARFAKATNSSLADSVDLLSGALKSYGKDASDADKVASIFFSTIDLGRINASELSNAFGRVGPVASQMGVSLEETGGALSALSVSGLKTSEALTQFRAILSALQKPSEAMEKRLAELSLGSGQSAIRTLGLAGTLDVLSKSTKGSAEDMARLFPNIRGLSGAVSLTADDLKTMSDNTRQMTEAAREFNKEQFLKATQTDAERVTKEINKLKNELTLGLGQAALNTADDLFKLTGGAENLVAAGKVAVPTLTAVAAGMVAVRAQTTLATAGLGGFSKALGALALVGVAAGVGRSIGNFLEQKRVDELLKGLRELEAGDREWLAKFEQAQGEARDTANRATDARVQAALKVGAELNRQYLKDVENFKAAEKKKESLLFDPAEARGGLFDPSKARGSKFDASKIRGGTTSKVDPTAKAFANFKSRFAVDEDALSKLLGRTLDTPDQVLNGLDEAGKRAAELRTQINQAVSGEHGVELLRQNVDKVFRDLEAQAKNREFAPGAFGEGLRAQFANVKELLKNLRSDSNITEDELKKVIEFRNTLGQDALEGGSVVRDKFGQLAFADTINLLDNAIIKLEQIKELQSNNGESSALQQELNAVNAILLQATPQLQNAALTMQTQMAPSAENLKLSFQATDLATLNINTGLAQAKTAAELIAGSAAATAAAYSSAAASAAQITANASSKVNRAFGGPAYHADGGSPRGTDTIPAMLSPGEFVINAQSSQRFFSQIQAINAGKQPVFRQTGGSITNIGDIHVSVKGGDTSDGTVRAIAHKLRREVRRGTIH